MSNTKKFIVKNGLITQNTDFVSPDASSTITAAISDNGVLSFEGSAGELFSISDSQEGTIYSVNLPNSTPAIEVDDNGTIRLAETTGNVLIGTNVDDGVNKLQVDGGIVGTLVGSADSLTTARTIALGGGVSGSASFDGSANVTITATVANNSHNHVIGNVDGLRAALDDKVNTSQLDTAATANSVAQRTSDGSLNANSVFASAARVLPSAGTTNTPESGAGTLNVYGADSLITNRTGALRLESYSPMGINSGTGVAFSSRVYSTGDTSYTFAKIGGYKESSISGDGRGYLSIATTTLAGDLTERLRINSSGNVGIGTSSPSARLHVENLVPAATNLEPITLKLRNTSDGGGAIDFSNGVNGRAKIGFPVDSVGAGTDEVSITFGTTVNASFTEKMRITPSGNLGIGTTSPNSKLDVNRGSAGSISSFSGVVGDRLDIGSDASGLYQEWNSNTAAKSQIRIQTRNSNAGAYSSIVISGGSQFINFRTNNTERMRIDSSGNVGIGISNLSSQAKLSVYGGLSDTNNIANLLDVGHDGSGSTGYQAVIRLGRPHTANRRVALRAIGTGLNFQSPAFAIDVNEAERMRIDSSGDVLVGTTSNSFSSKLTLLSTVSYNIESRRTGTGSEGHAVFVNGNGAVGSIFTSGTSTSYNTSSDYRLKEDWQPMSSPRARVMQLNPVNFAWKADSTRVDGFLAHELQEVIPEAVTGTKDEVDEKGEPVYQGIDQSKIVPLLTSALQEALQKIEQLEHRINTLEESK